MSEQGWRVGPKLRELLRAGEGKKATEGIMTGDQWAGKQASAAPERDTLMRRMDDALAKDMDYMGQLWQEKDCLLGMQHKERIRSIIWRVLEELAVPAPVSALRETGKLTATDITAALIMSSATLTANIKHLAAPAMMADSLNKILADRAAALPETPDA